MDAFSKIQSNQVTLPQRKSWQTEVASYLSHWPCVSNCKSLEFREQSDLTLRENLINKMKQGRHVTAQLLPEPCPCLHLENRLSQVITGHQRLPASTRPSRGTRHEDGVQGPLSEFSTLWMTTFNVFLFLHLLPLISRQASTLPDMNKGQKP